MDLVFEMKQIESDALADALQVAEHQRQSIMTEISKIKNEIVDRQRDSTITPEIRKEAEVLERAIDSAKWNLEHEKELLAKRKTDYENLQSETTRIRRSTDQKRRSLESEGPIDDGDEEIVEQIRTMKRKIETFKTNQSSQSIRDASHDRLNISRQCIENKRLIEMKQELETIGLESRAKNLEEELYRRRNEREEIEDQVRKLELSLQVTKKRNNALLLRYDVQIAEMQELNRSSRSKIADLTHEIEGLKRELRRMTNGGGTQQSSAMY